MQRSVSGCVASGAGAPQSASRSIRAVLFDVDGVLADTARLHTAAWRRLAAEEKLPFNEDDAHALRGLSREESLRRLLGDRSISTTAFCELMDRKNEYYLEAVSRLTAGDALPGAVELLADLCELGVACAAVSVSRNARAVLERLEMSAMLGAIIDGRDAEQSRSGLDRFHLAAAALRTAPRNCVVIEDSTTGIALARRAGMRTVGIGDRRRLAAADLVFESLRGVEGGLLLRWLAASRVDSPGITI